MQLGELTWKDVPDKTNRVVVLPLGSLEQHGRHLPLLTDSLVGEAILRQVERDVPEVVFLPMLWVGVSEHHRGFPGTVSVPAALYTSLVEQMVECLIQAGFRRIFVFNGHGGNEHPGQQALLNVQLRHGDLADLWLAMAGWWELAGASMAALEGFQQKEAIHACEIETSLVQAIRPDLVDSAEPHGAAIDFDSAFYSPDMSRPSQVYVPRAFHQLSRTGAFGLPQAANVTKGKSVFEVVVRDVAAFLREFAGWETFGPG
jgi:creatinine amidohydrolase